MTSLSALWLPIIVSAVAVFLASSIIHMVLPWHKSDYPKMPDEGRVIEALRPIAIPPGDYMVPRPASRPDMRSPEFMDKLNKGPVMIVTVLPNGMMSMGRNFVLWFLFCGVVGIFTAYVAGHALPPGAPWRGAFRFSGLTSFLCYSVALWPMSIWYRRAWSLTVKATVDGLLYALLTAAVFCWLWPL